VYCVSDSMNLKIGELEDLTDSELEGSLAFFSPCVIICCTQLFNVFSVVVCKSAGESCNIPTVHQQKFLAVSGKCGKLHNSDST
jgi:hypothetical protein